MKIEGKIHTDLNAETEAVWNSRRRRARRSATEAIFWLERESVEDKEGFKREIGETQRVGFNHL